MFTIYDECGRRNLAAITKQPLLLQRSIFRNCQHGFIELYTTTGYIDIFWLVISLPGVASKTNEDTLRQTNRVVQTVEYASTLGPLNYEFGAWSGIMETNMEYCTISRWSVHTYGHCIYRAYELSSRSWWMNEWHRISSFGIHIQVTKQHDWRYMTQTNTIGNQTNEWNANILEIYFIIYYCKFQYTYQKLAVQQDIDAIYIKYEG